MEMTQKEFGVFSKDCESKDGWKCKNTGYACKDYMCDKLKEDDGKMDNKRTVKLKPFCKNCDSPMAVEVLIKIRKQSRCPKCGRDLVVLK